MKRNGFTLIELLGVIILLALLMIIVFPSIVNSVKNSSDKTDDLTKELIYNAADLFIDEHINDFPKTNENKYVIELKELVDEGLLVSPIKLSDSDADITNSKCIQVTYNKAYKYELKDSGTCEVKYNLPIDYQKIEYIESTVTQYIDTGFIPNQDTGFDIVFLTKNAIVNAPTGGTTGYGTIIGTRENSLLNELQITTYNSSGAYSGTLRFGTSFAYDAGLLINSKMRLILKNKVYTNNQGIEKKLSETSFNAPGSLYVFALNYNGTVSQFGLVQIYSLKLYDGDTLVRDYIPCYHKLSNVIGLYDLIENKFYTNSGSGTFVKGNDI